MAMLISSVCARRRPMSRVRGGVVRVRTLTESDESPLRRVREWVPLRDKDQASLQPERTGFVVVVRPERPPRERERERDLGWP